MIKQNTGNRKKTSMYNPSYETGGPSYKTLYNRSYYQQINSIDDTQDSGSNWLVSMSDILSLLLVFFIMFLVMTKGSGADEKDRPAEYSIHEIPAVEVNPPVTIVEEKVRNEVTAGLNSLDLGDDISIQSTGKEITITIQEKVTFHPGEAGILPGFRPVLDKLALTLREHPELQVEITGHTDNVPIHTLRFPSNWELSAARSTNVLKYFIYIHALDPSRFSVKGYADQKPVAPNDTPENRTKNRRVEIRLKHAGV